MPSSPSPYDALAADIAAGEVILIDGGTGTELERRGAAMHDDAWCAMATRTAPDLLRAIHEDYVRAGARVITSNTYASGRAKLGPAGLGDEVEPLIRRSVEIAFEARERAAEPGKVSVAGSMSHMVPFDPCADGEIDRHYPPLDVLDAHLREAATLLHDAGVDFIVLEMIYTPEVAPLAIRAARATGLPVWVGLSVRRGRGRDGVASYLDPSIPFASLLDAAVPEGGDVFGVMHSDVDLTGPALEELGAVWSGPRMAYPDSGYFEMPHWQFVNIIAPGDFADAALGWIDSGTRIVGGCCGLGVEHIDALANALARR